MLAGSNANQENQMKYVLFLVTMLPFSSFAGDRMMSVDRSFPEAYFLIKVEDSGTLKGNWPGWCTDWGTLIEEGVNYKAQYYSTYSEDLPPGLVDHPENLDEVNWIINQNFVGQTSDTGLGVYTKGDVQLAIWTLLDDYFETSTVGEYSQARVDEIVALAREFGADFYPDCKQDIGIIIDPKDPDTGTGVQTTIVEVPRRFFPKCVVPEGEM